MWMWTLAYLALQRKNIRREIWMSQTLSELLTFSFFGFALGLPSIHELTCPWQKAFTCIPVAIHCSAVLIPLHQRFMLDSFRQVHALFKSTKCATFSMKFFWMTDQFWLPCGWKMTFPCNTVVRFFCYKQIFVVNACRFQISIWSWYISDDFGKKKIGGDIFWLQNCVENTGI